MPPSIPSEYVQGVDEFLATAASIVFGKSNFDNEDLDPILLALDLWEPAEGVSIWLGCHATEGLRKNFDSKVEAVHKSLIRIARTQAYLGRLDHTLQASPRAAKVMTKRVWVFEMYGAELNSFWSTLKKSLNISAKPTPKSEQTPPVVSDSQPPPSEIGLATCWCDKPRNLGGPTNSQATFVDLLIKNGGGMSHADLSVSGGFDWEDSRKGATNMAKRINQTLTNRGELWSIIPEDNSRCLIVLNSELETRS